MSLSVSCGDGTRRSTVIVGMIPLALKKKMGEGSVRAMHVFLHVHRASRERDLYQMNIGTLYARIVCGGRRYSQEPEHLLVKRKLWRKRKEEFRRNNDIFESVNPLIDCSTYKEKVQTQLLEDGSFIDRPFNPYS